MNFEDLVNQRVTENRASAASLESEETRLRSEYESVKHLARGRFLEIIGSARDYLAGHAAADLATTGESGWLLTAYGPAWAFIYEDGRFRFGDPHLGSGHWSPTGQFVSQTTALMKVSGAGGPQEQSFSFQNPRGIVPESGRVVNIRTWGTDLNEPANMIVAEPNDSGTQFYPKAVWPRNQSFYSASLDFDADGKLWVTYEEHVYDRKQAHAFDSWLANLVARRS